MPIRRVFLGWGQPAMLGACRFLVDSHPPRVDGEWDLENVIVVVPGARIGRILAEQLAREANDRGWTLIPPIIETVSHLPEQLYEPKRPFATAFVQRLAWMRAIERTDPGVVRELFPHIESSAPGRRARLPFPESLELASILQRLHFELAAECLSFRQVDDVLDELERVPGQETARAGLPNERRRWRAIERIEQAYLELLDAEQLWDPQTARLVAIERRECATSREIVLVGVADLNVAQRAMLDQVVDRVTALVFAPDSIADRFDEHGCIDPDAWQRAELHVDDAHWHVVDGPLEQAERVAEWVAERAAGLGSHEMVIGVPDPTLVPIVRRRLERAGAAARWGVGRPFPETSLARLLDAIADYLESPRYAEFAALIRHPDLHHWLARQPGCDRAVSACDAYFSTHLPPALGEWLDSVGDDGRVRRSHEACQSVLAPVRGAECALREWPERLLQVLGALMEGREFSRSGEQDHDSIEAIEALRDVLASMSRIPESLDHSVTAWAFLRLICGELASVSIAPPAFRGAIELLGWLELVLDPRPAAIVTSFNEGVIPGSVNADPFLPNALRRRLGLLDNHRRFARDAYAVEALVASRPHVDFLIARRDALGDPRMPSRLALMGDRTTTARRVARFLAHDEGPIDARSGADGSTESRPSVPRRVTRAAEREPTRFVVPPPCDVIVPRCIGVTALSTYLDCPYRFFLRHVRRLRSIDDAVEEMSAFTFGDILHRVLRKFGSSTTRDSTDAVAIRGRLEFDLDTLAAAQFGPDPRAAVRVQLGQMRARLREFAQWQARWASEGWRIVHVEQECNWTARDPNDVVITDGSDPKDGGATLTLVGTIDRIDARGPDEWTIFDYKSSDQGRTPEKAHQGMREIRGVRERGWIDLQLPVYRRMAAAEFGIPIPPASSNATKPIGLGYINLPKDLTQTREQIAHWTSAELEEADRTLEETVKAILSRSFWPPARRGSPREDEWTWVCQDQTLERRLGQSADESETPGRGRRAGGERA